MIEFLNILIMGFGMNKVDGFKHSEHLDFFVELNDKCLNFGGS